MRALFACLAVSLALAGCTSWMGGGESTGLPTGCPTADCSWEWWNASLSGGDERFRVGLPLRVGTPGTSFEMWLENLTVTGDARVEANESEHGRVLRVEGSGDVEITSYAFHAGPEEGCCAEDYLQGRWTTEAAAPEGLAVDVVEGRPFLWVSYRAFSSNCGGGIVHEGPVEREGWVTIPLQTADISCA